MVELREDINLSLKVFQLVGFIKSFLLIDLDGYFLVCTLTDAHLHNTIGTFAQLFVNLIILEFLLPLDLKLYIHELFL
jgi:hypothetical protein